MIQTIAQFIAACQGLDSDRIYEIVEYEITEDLYLELMQACTCDTPEPVRCALNQIGRDHGIQSLIDY